ncbi:hypothetical protein CQW23_30469 [Capsicum baccatum]|uniref:FAD-binding PCMH-type domain-containing protein n=1 Tax=Capsicum baccatum TaxID=33114 RepID=A0A2G2VAF5_CAPBA|nr:hypothetical protein CQW23_30469 [Capsicum baccatum]
MERCDKPSPTSPNYRQWERCGAMVPSRILNSISKDIANSVEYLFDSLKLWSELKYRYDQTNGAKSYQIQKEINDLNQGTLDITTYYSRMKKLWGGAKHHAFALQVEEQKQREFKSNPHIFAEPFPLNASSLGYYSQFPAKKALMLLLFQREEMGSLQILFVLLLSLFLAKCFSHEQQELLHCLSTYSESNITQHIYNPNSPTYTSILEYAQKNPRWWNSSHPIFIASPRTEAEIRPVILCSKKIGLQIKIKSGGHDYEGISFRSESPFVMLDLSNLNEIKIDLNEETAWVQSGATLGELYYAIAKRSKVHGFPGGVCFSVGTGGLISGGGLGALTRKFGLAADNVVDARVMDVNENILDREMNEDLFWAVRGGGGASFGVILSWKLKLVRVPEK